MMQQADKPAKSRAKASVKTSRIAFGSCNNQDRQNHLWSVIEARAPTAFIFGGDAIYADVEHHGLDFSTWPPKFSSRVECGTPDRVRELYEKQRQVPGYARLLEKNVTIFGTIDDHDFGCDNADRTFPHKHETTNAFVDFIREPQDSPMAQRAASGKGVYGVKLFDFGREEGDHVVPESQACIDPDYISSSSSSREASTCTPEYSNMTVAVFVLDVRTNKDPWKKGIDAYSTDYEGDYLGEEQWAWFEAAVANSNAAVNVIVNGLQVHSNIFPNPNIAENWQAFPYSQRRLWNAILARSTFQAPLLISGDVHMTQLHRKDCRPRSAHNAAPRPLVELTTSGMTHSWGRTSTPFVSYNGESTRVSDWIEVTSSVVARFFMHTLHQILPWRSLVVSSTDGLGINGGLEGAKQGLQYSLDRNFGELEFDWKDRTVTVRSLGEDPSAPPLIAARISMDQLSGRSSSTGMDHHSNDEDDWICVDYRGPASTFDEVLGYSSVVIVLLTIFVVIPVVLPLAILRKTRTRRRTTKWVPSSGDSVVSNSDTIPSMSSSVVSMDDLFEYDTSS